MDNVWLHAKGEIWDPIIDKFKAEGYWQNVIKRTVKPSVSELKKIKQSPDLPEQVIERHEFL
jgi:hypothetical protein